MYEGRKDTIRRSGNDKEGRVVVLALEVHVQIDAEPRDGAKAGVTLRW